MPKQNGNRIDASSFDSNVSVLPCAGITMFIERDSFCSAARAKITEILFFKVMVIPSLLGGQDVVAESQTSCPRPVRGLFSYLKKKKKDNLFSAWARWTTNPGVKEL